MHYRTYTEAREAAAELNHSNPAGGYWRAERSTIRPDRFSVVWCALSHLERARHFIVESKLVPEEMTHGDAVRGLAYEFSLVEQETATAVGETMRDLLAFARHVAEHFAHTRLPLGVRARGVIAKAEGR